MTLTYDNNGNVTAIGSLDYTWDWRNRIASAERTGAGGITTFGYDLTGARMWKATGSATTSYPNMYYTVASSSAVSTSTKQIFAPGGGLLATVEGSGVGTATTTYVHPDHLGGTNVVTDADGAVSQALDYYPYGAERVSSGSNATDRNFIGERYDSAEDLNYLNARYYRGAQGQFLSQDPVFWEIGLTKDGRAVLMNPQAQNSYSYAEGNPITEKDPDGRFIPQAIVFGGVLGGFAGGINQYVGDVRGNIQTGATGFSALAPQSSLREYGACISGRCRRCRRRD